MHHFLAISAVLAATLATLTAGTADFLSGADMSHLVFFENRGVVYKDGATTRDALAILSDRGVNCARLRLFTSSAEQAAADPYNYTNNLDYTLPLAVRAKAAGLDLLLDFHYSDTWADPAHQSVPLAWTNLSFTQLVAQMRAYNSNCFAAFAAAGARPDYVQVGNEITQGLLWPHGRVGGSYENPTQWSKLGQLLKAAVQGIHDAAGTNRPGIIVHIDRGGDWAATQWYFDKLTAQNVPFDIIGLSFYPFWHGTLPDLDNCLTNAAARYQKPVIVAETAFPFSNSTNIYNIPASTNGQVQFVTALAEVVKGVPGGRGMGIFWWGSEYQRLSGYNLAGFDKRSLFGSGGGVLPAATAMGQLNATLTLSTSVSNQTLQMRWPLSGAGMALTASSNPAESAVWRTVTNSVTNTNMIYSTNVPIETGSNRFYRLQSR